MRLKEKSEILRKNQIRECFLLKLGKKLEAAAEKDKNPPKYLLDKSRTEVTTSNTSHNFRAIGCESFCPVNVFTFLSKLFRRKIAVRITIHISQKSAVLSLWPI